MSREPELALKGKGVAPVRIAEIDDLVRDYVLLRHRRAKLSSQESEAKAKVMDAMHNHAEELEQPDGDLVYAFNGTIVSLIAGDEKLKVEIKEG